MSEPRHIPKMDAELRAAGIQPFAGLPWHNPRTGRREPRVGLARLRLQWVVSQGFWDRYLAPLLNGDDTLQITYGGWPVLAMAGAGEWVRLEEATTRPVDHAEAE